jgi:hypothetical protein
MRDTKPTEKSTNKRDKGYFAPTVPPFSFGRKFDDGGGKKHYTPWLVVRYAAGDDGTRPLPGGTVFWESPDVWVTSSLGVNQPVPGEANTVFARVSNLGLQDATGVFVKFWWADPSLAITEASANLIGIGSVNLTAGSSAVVTCPNPWVPVVENGGHECLIAEAFSGFDPLTAPMDPVDDRHVGQKNEQLVFAPKGQRIVVKLQAANISSFAQALTFEVQPLHLTKVPDLLVARVQNRLQTLTPASNALPLSLQMAAGPRLFAGPSTQFARRLLTMTLEEAAGTATVLLPPAQITHTEHLEPWETRTLELAGQVPSDAKPGQIFAFRVIQRAGRMITGGYTVHLVVTDR